uniref:Uncharacterized protein n=1 Tax=Anguilla anguilla TaxID=7936 RepID=A0A0E9UE07_ANGAN
METGTFPRKSLRASGTTSPTSASSGNWTKIRMAKSVERR